MNSRNVRSRNMSCSPKNGLNGERRLGNYNLRARTLLIGVRQVMVIKIAGSLVFTRSVVSGVERIGGCETL